LQISALWKSTYGTFDSPDFVGGTCAGTNCESQTWQNWANDTYYFGYTRTGMIGIVLSMPYTVGYATLESGDQTIIQYAQIQNAAGAYVQPSVASVQEAITYYLGQPQANPLSFSIAAAPTAGAYPFSYLYQLVYDSTLLQADCCLAQEFVGLVHFILFSTNGDEYATDNLFVPLTAALKQVLMSRLIENITCLQV